MPDKYTCAKCGETFDKGWSDEEAETEYGERFAEEKAANEPREVWCDDCYKILMSQ